jgi:hypothetical protein
MPFSDNQAIFGLPHFCLPTCGSAISAPKQLHNEIEGTKRAGYDFVFCKLTGGDARLVV